MWYGCLPSLAVIVVAMAIPDIGMYFTNLLAIGNPYKRYLDNTYATHTYLRDMRLGNGDPYKQLGLDCLSEDPVVEKEACKCD